MAVMNPNYSQFDLTYQDADDDSFGVCATYPTSVVVPAAMGDDDVVACSKVRSKERFPALSWYVESKF